MTKLSEASRLLRLAALRGRTAGEASRELGRIRIHAGPLAPDEERRRLDVVHGRTIREAAAMLGVTTDTLHQFVRAREKRGVDTGRVSLGTGRYAALSPSEIERRLRALAGRVSFQDAALALGMPYHTLVGFVYAYEAKHGPIPGRRRRDHTSPRKPRSEWRPAGWASTPEGLACYLMHDAERVSMRALRWAARLRSAGPEEYRTLVGGPEFRAFLKEWDHGAWTPNGRERPGESLEDRIEREAKARLANAVSKDNPFGDPEFIAKVMAGPESGRSEP